MRELNKIAQELFDKLRSRFEKISLGDENAKHTTEPEEARFFNFDYDDEEGKYGNVTISVPDGESLKVFFGRNISQHMTDESKDRWYDFLRSLRFFAKRNLLTFDTRDISRSNLELKDIKQASKADGTYSSMEIANESRMYGTNKTSFENVGSARIRIVHNESIDAERRGSRSRSIQAIYVENNQGERFKLAHNKLSGARAMARHIAEGGAPYDDIGQHINVMVQEMVDLGRFVRTMKHRTFEDTTTSTMVEAAASYYTGIHNQLNHMRNHRAYKAFLESFQPQTEQLDEVDVNELKEKFVKKIFDDRMTAALPVVNKAYKIYEQSKQQQLESVRNIVTNQAPLTLVTNEGMDEYFRTVNFGDSKELVVRVLEDIANRAEPQVAEFANHWVNNFYNISEDSDSTLKEHQALAVKLATHYLRDLRNLKENTELRVASEDRIGNYESELDLYEGTWALPDTPEEIQALQTLLANPIVAGADGENATGALYDLIGDDGLFDKIGEFAELAGPKADVRDVIKNYLKDEMPGLYQKLGLTSDEQMDAGQTTPPVSPQPMDATNEPVPPPAQAPTAGTGMDTPMGANLAEDAELVQMLRIAGILVK